MSGTHRLPAALETVDAMLAVRQLTSRRPPRGQDAAGQSRSANGHATAHQQLPAHLN